MKTGHFIISVVFCTMIAMTLIGCGQKGDLYLPLETPESTSN